MIEKKGVIVFFGIFLFLGVVSAIGVSPPGYDVNFEPNLQGDYSFTFFTEDPNEVLAIFVGEPYDQYVVLTQNEVQGRGVISAKMNLPSSLDPPGRHRIMITAAPKSAVTGGTVGAVASVSAVIDVYVSYPGKYGDVKFSLEGLANAGEDIPYKLTVFSRGNEDITTSGRIEVKDSENKSVLIKTLDPVPVSAGSSITLDSTLETSELPSGDYNVTAYISDSARETISVGSFRLGKFDVKVVNYTKEIVMDEINPFSVEVESVWNGKIDNLYAEIFVEGTEISFLTPTVSLERWGRTVLTGYMDTTKLEAEPKNVRVVLHYQGNTKEQLLPISASSEFKVNWTIIILVAVIVLLAAFLFWISMRIRKLEHGKKK